jgi:hypothetical protein
VQPDAVSPGVAPRRRPGPDGRGDRRGAGHRRPGCAQHPRRLADACPGRDQVVDDHHRAGRDERGRAAAQAERASHVGRPGSGVEAGRVFDRPEVSQRPHDVRGTSERAQLGRGPRGEIRHDVATPAPALPA